MAECGVSYLVEDGYLNVQADSRSIIYHPNLNIILVTTRDSEVLALDVNSGVILQKSSLSGKLTWALVYRYTLDVAT